MQLTPAPAPRASHPAAAPQTSTRMDRSGGYFVYYGDTHIGYVYGNTAGRWDADTRNGDGFADYPNLGGTYRTRAAAIRALVESR